MKGIIFDAESVRAILAGTKTQTRRVLSEQPVAGFEPYGQVSPNGTQWFVDDLIDPDHPTTSTFHIQARYRPGETVYVKETFRLGRAPNDEPGQGISLYEDMSYKPHPDLSPERHTWCREWRKRSPIHMPEWAARAHLEITQVRVEKLLDISDADICAELGIPEKWPGPGPEPYTRQLDLCFAVRWDEINQKRGYGWNTDPWVFIYEFRRIER